MFRAYDAELWVYAGLAYSLSTVWLIPAVFGLGVSLPNLVAIGARIRRAFVSLATLGIAMALLDAALNGPNPVNVFAIATSCLVLFVRRYTLPPGDSTVDG